MRRDGGNIRQDCGLIRCSPPTISAVKPHHFTVCQACVLVYNSGKDVAGLRIDDEAFDAHFIKARCAVGIAIEQALGINLRLKVALDHDNLAVEQSNIKIWIVRIRAGIRHEGDAHG